jgi:predicted nucleic acid-binding protein
MTPALWVANSSPLIVFQRIGRFTLLRDLVRRLPIPPMVRREVFGTDPLPEWVEERMLTQPLASQIIAARIGPGEREAIALALEVKATWLIIDDLAGRRLAHSLGITVIGSVGLLLKAQARGLIPAVRPLMEAMQREDFRISERVFTAILAAAGEN